jgi:hypothetical protein
MIRVVIVIHVGNATDSHFEAAETSTTVYGTAALCNHILLQSGRADGSFYEFAV